MDTRTSTAILDRVRAVREKRAVGTPEEAFAQAVQGVAADRLRTEALKDVLGVGALGLGAGVAGRGALGLYQLLQRNQEKKKTRSGPVAVSHPFPAIAEPKLASFLSGGAAGDKSGIPWYGPAMMGVGLAGLAGGWKGVDAVLDARRRSEKEKEMADARQAFQEALLSQYNSPIKVRPGEMAKAAAAETPGTKLGRTLDRAFEKAALTVGGVDLSNLAGQATGAYGIYAGGTGLLAGSLLYDRFKKRSRKAVIDKALQRRQRRQFMQSPTELYADPVPVPAEDEG